MAWMLASSTACPFPLWVKRRTEKPEPTVQSLDGLIDAKAISSGRKSNMKKTSFSASGRMTPRFIDIVYAQSNRVVSPRQGEKHKLHLVLFTLGASRQFSLTPELINASLNEREQCKRECNGRRKKLNTRPDQCWRWKQGVGKRKK